MIMNRRNVLLSTTASVAVLVGCSTTGHGDGADAVSKRREIDAASDAALSDLYANVPGARELVSKSRGVLLFPKVVSAGFVIGGIYGQGVLRKAGKTAGYYSVGAGSVGLLAGAQSKSLYLLFMTPEALEKFEASKGWTVGGDASVAVLDAGASVHADSKTVQSPIIGFVRNQAGLMANLSIDGTKFSKLDL
jgi:lipid-binding SYLF domain-containing protein